ncbi:MAG: CDP-alcohol phosphatidyltransferase family protein [Candidatus Micrarchaeota archaeon]|nr:CDP-alcohol phosphatidyltransferase family protein [Candidatus Micrarchaeota archaeon]
MRSADIVTLSRIPILALIMYLVIIQFNAWVSVILFGLIIALDGLDGYAAVHDESKGKVSLGVYLKASVLHDAAALKTVKGFKEQIGKSTFYAPRMDIAGDRIVEYSFWALFTFLHVLPLFVIIIVIIRHSIVDAFMANKGTSSRMKTRLAKIMYSSSVARGEINVVKAVTFGYLILQYVAGWPSMIGYALVAILVINIILRGVAEVGEALASNRK